MAIGSGPTYRTSSDDDEREYDSDGIVTTTRRAGFLDPVTVIDPNGISGTVGVSGRGLTCSAHRSDAFCSHRQEVILRSLDARTIDERGNVVPLELASVTFVPIFNNVTCHWFDPEEQAWGPVKASADRPFTVAVSLGEPDECGMRDVSLGAPVKGSKAARSWTLPPAPVVEGVATIRLGMLAPFEGRRRLRAMLFDYVKQTFERDAGRTCGVCQCFVLPSAGTPELPEAFVTKDGAEHTREPTNVWIEKLFLSVFVRCWQCVVGEVEDAEGLWS